MTSLATKVKGLREVKGLGLTQLAKRVPVERSYLSQIEHGKATNLGRNILQGLAKELDVGVDYLVDDSTDEACSWEKVASDESLALFLKRNDISEEERDGLRRVSFTKSAPRTLEGWEQLWNNLKAYSRPKRSGQSSRNKPRPYKNMNSRSSLADPTSQADTS